MIKKILLVVALLSGMITAHAQIKINEVQTSNSLIKDTDFNASGDWIELYNAGTAAVNMKGYFITDNKDKPRKWEFTKDFSVPAKGFAIVWCDGKDVFLKEPHTNFKVSSAGEAIRLYSNTMLLLDSVKVPLVERNYSYGRTTDGTGDFALLKKTSFKASNNSAGYFKGMAPQPKISLKGGWYSSSQSVTISSSLAGATIRYTTDGSEPTAKSPEYKTGTTILAEKKTGVTQKYGYNRENKTGIQNGSGWPAMFSYPSNRYNGNRDFNFVLKAKVFHDDYMTSNTSGETYFINERKPTLPVISLSIDKKYLFDKDSGIYIQGTNGAIANYGGADAKYNWAQDWAYPAHIEFFDANGVKQFANTMTIEVFGAASRSFDLKSLAVKCKNKYENAQIDYPIFGDDGLKSYQSFILRNSGNDWAQGNFARDAIIQQIVRGQIDLETQDYQPVALFINGEYWSLMNMRERLSSEYFAGYHDYASNIDLLKTTASSKTHYEASEGDTDRYWELLTLLGPNAKTGTKTDLSTNQTLYNNLVTNYVDADNIINYFIAQTYCDNGDWPHNNARMWRPRVENGKFRYPLYDTDFGYGLWGNNNNALENALSDTDAGKTWSTVIFRSLLTNPDFKAEFIQRYAYMLNTVYSASRFSAIADPISSAISAERDQYTNPEWVRSSDYGISAMKTWNDSRINTMRSSINSHARLGAGKGYANYTVQYTSSQGKVQLCGLDVANNYAGQQMLNMPIRMTALPAAGYQFKQWEDGSGKVLSTAQEFSYTMTAAATVKAVFETRANLAPGSLRINELMASNKSTYATEFGDYTDWFEIYNPGTTAINLAGLYVSNTASNTTLYQIPYGNAAATTVPAKGFLLLWASKDTYSGITHLPFKLNKDGGVIILSQKTSAGSVVIIDNLSYGAQNPDISFGRFPDGNANLIIFENPTPQKTNEIAPMPAISNVYITEILAKNASINKEETGNYADWFELYNDNNEAVDIGGLYVTNDYADLNMYQIPRGQSAKTTIPKKSYMIMWADKQTAINPNHVDFKLNRERGQLALVQVRNSVNYVIDSVTYRNQGEDVSYGRYPNANSSFRYLATPTPSAQNVSTGPTKIANITINEVLAENTGIFPENGKYHDYIEFYNAGTTAVDLGGLFVSDSLSYSLKYRIPRGKSAETTIQPKQWLTFYASSDATLGTRHCNFALDKAGEAVVLSQVTANGLEQLDYIAFGAQSVNVSYGRFPETATNWELMEPTPNAANVSAESSANLKTLLSSSGTITPAVAKGVFEYTCLLPSSVTTAPTISATAINAKAKVEITQATSINGKARIFVTSANGYETAEYFVSFANDPSGDASLKSLTASVGTLAPAFASNVYNYTLTFSSSTKPLFTAIAGSANAKVEIVYSTKASEPTIIRVTSENNTKQEYKITYQSNPVVLSQWDDNFSDGIGCVKQVSSQYTLTEKSGNLQVQFKKAIGEVAGYFEYQLPENTVVSAPSPKDLFVTIVARLEDGSGSTSVGMKCRIIDMYGYEATNRPYDENGHSIGMTKGEYEADFTTTQTVDRTRVSGVRFVLDPDNNSSAKNKTLIIERIVIGPKLGDVQVFSKNADLKTLTTSAGALSPAFNANTLEYTVTLPAGTTTIPTISATKADAKASLQISPPSSLNSVATITVVAEDVLTVKNYTVRFVVTPSVVDGHTDNILQPALLAWSEDSPMYELSYSSGVLNVAYARTGAGSPAIQYNILNGENKILDLTKYPYFSVKLKSTTNVALRADLYDANGKTASVPVQQVALSTNYSVYTFDFTGLLTSLTTNKIYGVQLYFDAGTTAAKSGTIVIDEVRFGSAVEMKVNTSPVIATIPAQSVERTKPFAPINLNDYVTDDNTPVKDLQWSASTAENLNVSIVNNVVTVTVKNAAWVGEEQITFTVTDEDNATATRSVRFTVTELVIPIDNVSFAKPGITILLGETLSIAAEVIINPSNATDKTLTYTSSNPLVLQVGETTGIITAKLEGTVYITVTSANGKSAQCEVKVQPILAESVRIIPASITLDEGDYADLTVEILPENTTHKTVSWTSNNTNVATVSDGKVLARSKGTVTIVAAVNGIEAECEVTVVSKEEPVISISLPATMDLEVEETAQLSVQFNPEGATNKILTWSSNAPGIVSVTSEGKITALAIGTAQITAETMNNKTAKITVTVRGIEPTDIVLSPAVLTLTEGETSALSVTVVPTNVTNTTVTWKSSSTSIATVVGGVVTALAEGKATITATTHNGKAATCEVTVKPVPVESITLSNIYVKLAVNEYAQITATILPANATNKTVEWSIADETIATVSATGRITANAKGETVLTATTADERKTATCVVIVEEIDIPVVSIQIVEGNVSVDIDATFDFTVAFTPESPSNTTVFWTSSDPTVATISGGKVTALKAGVTEIQAVTGNGKTSTITLTVNAMPAASITLSKPNLTLYNEESATITAEILPAKTSDKAISWSSLDETVATVDNGKITAHSVGSTTITATTHNGIIAECKVTVLPVEATNIFLNTPLITIAVGGKETMQVTFVPANTSNKTIDWKIADETIAAVDANGVVTGLAAGTTTLTATSANGKTAMCMITVSEIVIPVVSISLPAAIAVDIDATAALTVTFEPKNATNKTLTWTSSNNTIVQVSTEGVITGRVAGTAEITARSVNNKTATILVTVNPMLATSITLSPNTLSLVNGKTATLTAEILPEKTTNKTITWTSSKTDVATVDKNGVVTALSVGTTTITATTTNGKTASCVLIVTPVLAESVTLNASELSLGIGEQPVNLVATVLPANTADKSLTWSINKPLVASIDDNGLITPLTEGTATVTVTTANGKTATCNITVFMVTIPVEKLTILDGRGMPITLLTLHVDDTHQFSALVEPANATDKTVTWTSSNPTIAPVVNGKITALIDGQTQITITSKSGPTASVTVTVLPLDVEEIRLQPQYTEVFVSEKVSIQSEVLPAKAKDKTLTWTSSDTNIATVDNNGVVTTINVGNVSITARSVNNITKTTTIRVKPLDPENVTITTSNPTVQVEGTLQLTYSVFPANADKTVTWQSGNENILTVNQNGLITGVGVGSATVTVRTVNGLTDKKEVTVTPILPTNIASSPSSITLAKGETAATPIVVTLQPANATDKSYTFSIVDETIATIDEQGFITALAEGDTRLKVSANANDKVFVFSNIKVIQGKIDVTGVTIDGSNDGIKLNLDAMLQLTVTLQPANATNTGLTWEIEDPTIASISPSGMITALKLGSTTVTVTTTNGTKGTKTIIVSPVPPFFVTIIDGKLEMYVDETMTLTAHIEPENTTDKSVTWSAENGFVSIDKQGVVTALSKGSETITVTTVNGLTAQWWVTVSPRPLIAVEDLNFGPDANLLLFFNEEREIQFTTTPPNADRSTIQWVSSDVTIATVDEQGVIHASDKDGTITITAKLQNGSEKTLTLIVIAYSEAPEPLPIPEQKALQGEIFIPLALKNYFIPYNANEQLTYGCIIPADSKFSGRVASDGTFRIAVNDPAWFGSETITVTARNDRGMETKNEVVFTVIRNDVGITPVFISTINAYPTVTATYTTVSISSAVPANYTLSVFDLEGKLIETHRLFVSETVQKIIDFTNLPRGVYTCVVAGENEKQSVKIIVE